MNRPTLALGSPHREAVEALQTLLNGRGESLKVDGAFGPMTRAAVVRFQQATTELVPDGVVGPLTWRKLVPIAPIPMPVVDDAIEARRSAVVAVAKAEIGDQKKGHPIVLEYWRDVGVIGFDGKPCNDWQLRQAAGCIELEDAEEWCGIFALWCLKQANVAPKGVMWKLGSGFARRFLKVTPLPEPGDIFIGPADAYHHGIVESYKPRLLGADGKTVLNPGQLVSIEGNTPTVTRRTRPAPTLYTYYSIMPWLKQAVGVVQ